MDRPIRDVRIVNRMFWLHSRATAYVLASLSALVAVMEWYGDAIDCTANGAPADDIDVEEYCWAHSTFTGPGKGHVRQHGHYQWASTVLMLQSICFSVPGFVWRILEKGRVQTLVQEDNVDATVDYVLNRRRRRHRFAGYAARSFLCEILNLINVVGQLFFVNYFLDFYFTGQPGYGLDVRRMFVERSASDPIGRVLPMVAVCTFGLRTPAGATVQADAVCTLPVNSINEKNFTFLWLWLSAMTVVSFTNVLYRATVILSSRLRTMLLWRWAHEVSAAADVEIVASKCDTDGWFVLYLLQKNIHPDVFGRTVSKLADRLGNAQNW